MSVISKKLINNVEDTVAECLQGFSYTYPQLTLHEKHRFISARPNKFSKGKVALLSGGGSGHEPFATGYVGKGMLDGAVAGSVFTSPPSSNIFYGIKYLNEQYKGGIFVFIPNYTGDRLNFGMAIEKAKSIGLQVNSIILGEDLASESNTGTGSRGMCGMSVIYKMIGALSEKGANIKEIQQTTDEILQNMSTFGASLTACSLPGQPPLFHVDDDKLELGIGVHGEAGVSSIKMCTSKELVDLLLAGLREKLKLSSGSEVVLFVNNLGAVSHLELNIVCYDAVSNLKKHDIKAKRVYAGPIMTSMDMVGVQLCLLKLPPNKCEEWLQLLDAETEAPAWVGRKVNVQQKNEQSERFETEAPEEQMVSGPKLTQNETLLFSKCLTLCADELKTNEEILNRLDSGCGDGDCGTTLKNLALGINAYISQNDMSYPARVFVDLSELAESTMGGTSGAIYSLGFSAASNVFASIQKSNQSVWLKAMTEAVTSIAKYGGATIGDRSMMDTLIPAVEAFEKHQSSDISRVFKEIVKAGEVGCDTTASMKARVGRASYVSSERVNERDAGALAVLFWLKALEQAFTDQSSQ